MDEADKSRANEAASPGELVRAESHDVIKSYEAPADESRYFREDDVHAAELRASIEEARQRISESFVDVRDNVEHLRDNVRDQLDWQHWVARHPWESVGIAFGIGVLMGMRR